MHVIGKMFSNPVKLHWNDNWKFTIFIYLVNFIYFVCIGKQTTGHELMVREFTATPVIKDSERQCHSLRPTPSRMLINSGDPSLICFKLILLFKYCVYIFWKKGMYGIARYLNIL